MWVIFAVFVLLILTLTGAIVPVIIFGGWLLVLVLGCVLLLGLLRFFLKVGLRVVLAPVVLAVDLLKQVRSKPASRKYPDRPQVGDPDYLDWANRRGKYENT